MKTNTKLVLTAAGAMCTQPIKVTIRGGKHICKAGRVWLTKRFKTLFPNGELVWSNRRPTSQGMFDIIIEPVEPWERYLMIRMVMKWLITDARALCKREQDGGVPTPEIREPYTPSNAEKKGTPSSGKSVEPETETPELDI